MQRRLRNCNLNILTFENSEEGKKPYWHTASHILAQAVKRLYPNTKLGIGPAIDNGFYYDFKVEKPLTEEDMGKIEEEMKKIIKEDLPLERSSLSREEAIKLMKEKNEDYKVQLIEELPEGEPVFLLSYQEQNFILAEMAIRGLIENDAKVYYEEGIRASMKFVSENTPDNVLYHHDRKITDEYIIEYLKRPGVVFETNFQKQLEQIIWQKYIMTFLQTPYNAYFEYRRTGIPDFPINPRSNRNIPSDKMPLRWMYPTDELSYKMDNVSKAIDSQYGGSDDYMGIMWILQ